MLDILCIGDSVIDVFLKIPLDNPKFGLDKKNDKLLINYGDKINVDKYVIELGGNATNTSVGISRLGLNTGLCAEIGKDEFSQKIINVLRNENINLDNLIQDNDSKTSITVVLSYAGDRTLFTEHVERKHNFNFENIETNFIYLTSLGAIWENAYEKTLEFIKNKNAKLAFNPGTLQLEKRDKIIFDIVEKTNYLFVNKEEAEELLYGKELEIQSEENKESLIKKMLFGLKGLGAKNVIITDSDRGSYLQDEKDNTYFLGVLNEEVVEKTGAGDSYTAGFLAAILNGGSGAEAMVWGTLNATSVIKKIGAEEGLLTKFEMLEKIKENNKFSPQNF